ncbi:tRNA splicing endonuclease subunit sen2 [Linnemannia hyalina]|uniref:tRNA-intron lyase n=1 Tax=Linnemannia hyalina TaxID=64524 RepID=A0A9P7Y6Z7_9FUNG|nr:tRNA splicing endonuclease subunit sen2 [Linnemannia hyalina]
MGKLVQAAQGNASGLTTSTTPVISSNTSSTNASVSTTPTSTVSSATQSQDPQSNKTVQQSIMLLISPVGDEPEGVHQETVGSSSSGSGENEEHLQLSLEEAFFLVFAVECIAVSEQKTTSTCDQLLLGGGSVGLSPFSIQECWLRFAQASVFAGKSSMALPMPMLEISPDNPFIVRYAAYHHYRSLGWVVKDGLKYGTDFLLYKKGVMFGHSQFGIRVIACKSADEVTSNTTQQHWSTGMSPLDLPRLPLSSTTPGLFAPHAVHSWQWLLALNRVISQVQKVKN